MPFAEGHRGTWHLVVRVSCPLMSTYALYALRRVSASQAECRGFESLRPLHVTFDWGEGHDLGLGCRNREAAGPLSRCATCVPREGDVGHAQAEDYVTILFVDRTGRNYVPCSVRSGCQASGLTTPKDTSAPDPATTKTRTLAVRPIQGLTSHCTDVLADRMLSCEERTTSPRTTSWSRT